jgi:uncharacterized membrane protein YhaH (DUF805 family)
MKWYLLALSKYVVFTGRSRRSEFWYFTLFNLIFAIAAMVLDMLLGITFGGIGYGPIYVIYVLAMMIPGLAVAVRRLHDVGKSGFMIFIALIPIVGAIWLIVLYATDSDAGDNEYGPNPKDVKPVSTETLDGHLV